MAHVTSIDIQAFPAYKAIGLAYRVKMMDNVIPQKWDLFFKEGQHVLLENLRKDYPIQEPLDYIGLMYGYDPIEQTMIYLIGAIMDQNTPDQPGYTSYALPAGLALTAVVEGKAETYGQAHDLTLRCIDEQRYTWPEDFWSMEIYSERFMKAMEKQDGTIVLDYRIPVLRK